jgi:hypothetical protein
LAYSCIPVGKLKKFLTAWSKATTSAPTEAPELQPSAAKKKRGAQRIKLIEPPARADLARDPACG